MTVALKRITIELYTFTIYFGRATSEWVRLFFVCVCGGGEGRVAGSMV